VAARPPGGSPYPVLVQDTLPGLDLDILQAEDEFISPEEAQAISQAAQDAFERLLIERPDLLPVADGFFMALAKGWDWRKALYIAWARLPRKARWPETINELAGVMGLRSARTIRKWRARNVEIDRLVVEEMVARAGERTADVLEALAELASTADYKNTRAMELYLRIHGVYTPEQTVRAEVLQAGVFIPETSSDGEAS
jgi:hypothetical protein